MWLSKTLLLLMLLGLTSSENRDIEDIGNDFARSFKHSDAGKMV